MRSIIAALVSISFSGSCLADGMNWKLGTAERAGISVDLASPCPSGLDASQRNIRWISLTSEGPPYKHLASYTTNLGGYVPDARKRPELQPRVIENKDGTAFALHLTLEHFREGTEPMHTIHFEAFRVVGGRVERVVRPDFADILRRAFETREKAGQHSTLVEVSSVEPLKWVASDQLQVRVRGSYISGTESRDCVCYVTLESRESTLALKSIVELGTP